jgi:membrane-bound ClpP family serine protease
MEANMKRCIDLIGIAGFVILVISTLLLFPRSAEQMIWTYWLAGLVLWFMGFAFLVGWLILRWSMPKSHEGPPPLLIWSRSSTRKDVAAAANGKVRKQAA